MFLYCCPLVYKEDFADGVREIKHASTRTEHFANACSPELPAVPDSMLPLEMVQPN